MSTLAKEIYICKPPNVCSEGTCNSSIEIIFFALNKSETYYKMIVEIIRRSFRCAIICLSVFDVRISERPMASKALDEASSRSKV